VNRQLILIWIVTVSISGCLFQANPSKQGAESRASSVVAMTLPEFQLLPGDPVSWYADILWIDPQQLLSGRPAMRGQLKKEIRTSMADRRYRFVKQGEAKYEVFAAVVLGDFSTAEEKRLNAFFNIDPTLRTNSDRYPEGTLLMAIGERDNPQALWRGAVKMFILGSDVLDVTAQQRLKKYVNLLVESIPRSSLGH